MGLEGVWSSKKGIQLYIQSLYIFHVAQCPTYACIKYHNNIMYLYSHIIVLI